MSTATDAQETPTTPASGAETAPAAATEEWAAFSTAFREQESGLAQETDPAAATETPADRDGQNSTPGEPQQPAESQPEEPLRLSRAEWERITSTVGELERRVKKQMDDYGGRIGGLQQALQHIKDQVGRGRAVAITDEDFAELKADFPELADMTRKGLERVLGRIGASAGAAVDIAALRDDIARDQARRRLEEEHEDWAAIVGIPDESGKIPDTPFRQWVATKPTDEQEKIWSSWNPRYLSRVLTEFKSTQAKKTDEKPNVATKTTVRQSRLASAVPPKGAGGGGAASNEPLTEAQAFLEAFKREIPLA